MANSAPPWVTPAEFVVTVNGTPSSPDANTDTFKTGQQNVDTAGVPVQLGSGAVHVKPGTKLTVIARSLNAGVIYFANTESECVAGQYFDGLLAGLAHSFGVTSPADVWIDAAVSTDGVSWYCEVE